MAFILDVSTKKECRQTAKTKELLGKLFLEHIIVFTISQCQKRE